MEGLINLDKRSYIICLFYVLLILYICHSDAPVCFSPILVIFVAVIFFFFYFSFVLINNLCIFS